jgi:hypothetical protein
MDSPTRFSIWGENSVWAISPRSGSPSPTAAGEFSRLLDRFVAYHLGLSWEHGTFVKN